MRTYVKPLVLPYLFSQDRYVGLYSLKSKYGVEVFPPLNRGALGRIESKQKQKANKDERPNDSEQLRYRLKIFDTELSDAAIYKCQNRQVTLGTIAPSLLAWKPVIVQILNSKNAF